MGSSQTRARTCVLCIGRQILNHCTTRELPIRALKAKLISLPSVQLFSSKYFPVLFFPACLLVLFFFHSWLFISCTFLPLSHFFLSFPLFPLTSFNLLSISYFCFPTYNSYFVPALLRYNSHTTQFTHLKWTFQWFLLYSWSCATITATNFRIFLSSPKKLSAL